MEEHIYDIDRPFRVYHTNSDVLKGFEDLASAQQDAKDRNARAMELGIEARYKAIAKP